MRLILLLGVVAALIRLKLVSLHADETRQMYRDLRKQT